MKRDTISIVCCRGIDQEYHQALPGQYLEGCSALWGIPSLLWRRYYSTDPVPRRYPDVLLYNIIRNDNEKSFTQTGVGYSLYLPLRIERKDPQREPHVEDIYPITKSKDLDKGRDKNTGTISQLNSIYESLFHHDSVDTLTDLRLNSEKANPRTADLYPGH